MAVKYDCCRPVVEREIMSDEPRKQSSLRIEGGVRRVLEDLQAETAEQLRNYLLERRAQGWNDLADSEIETISRKAGMVSRSAAGTAIGQAFQLGVDKSVNAEAHDRPTARGEQRSPIADQREDKERK